MLNPLALRRMLRKRPQPAKTDQQDSTARPLREKGLGTNQLRGENRISTAPLEPLTIPRASGRGGDGKAVRVLGKDSILRTINTRWGKGQRERREEEANMQTLQRAKSGGPQHASAKGPRRIRDLIPIIRPNRREGKRLSHSTPTIAKPISDKPKPPTKPRSLWRTPLQKSVPISLSGGLGRQK